MSGKRAKDDIEGSWFYCPSGHRAYEIPMAREIGFDSCYFCKSCGYFDKVKAIINSDNPMKNVRQIKVIE